MTATRWTVNSIKDAVRATGSHWFDPDTMRQFGTRVLPTVYQGRGGVYFVTEDDQYRRELPKRFTVRSFDPAENDIGTHSKLCEFADRNDAIEEAKTAASSKRGEFETVTEDFKPVSVLEQFTDDLIEHGISLKQVGESEIRSTRPRSSVEKDASSLIELARKHHRYMERLCGDEAFCRQCDEDGEHPRVKDCREHIALVARHVGATEVIFSGDPRGCTVKLTFADGFTNDFAHEGYCVPTDAR